ncbi:MAG TPA: anti-sigma factor, partial [Usitatibacteraceae bacterium]|nr:anti-sigma factor [Usitatibacteraceae bacterium]
MSRDEEQDRLLHERFDPVLLEPLPARLQLRRPSWIGYARAASVLAAGIAIGLALPRPWRAPEAALAAVPAQALPARAARAHLVYAMEVRHPVEVDASQQEHLVAWLSKRLSTPIRAPSLVGAGYQLLGGRLLPPTQPSDPAPMALLMYEN